MRIRSLVAGDLDAVLALNAAEVPRVGPLDAGGLDALIGWSDLALVADGQQGLAALLIALAPGSDYQSANYRFFERRGTDHLYIDRVAVAAHARRRGLGSRLYDAVEAHARASGREEITCEVNVEPRNDISLAFHAARGFVEIGQQDVGDHRVALLARPLGNA